VNATAAAGPMQFTRFAPTHSLGSFGNSASLRFTCLQNASDPNRSLALAFSYNLALEIGDSVHFFLPGFEFGKLSNHSTVICQDQHSVVAGDVAWNNSTKMLIFNVSRPLPSNTPLSISTRDYDIFKRPLVGNSSVFTVSASAVAGSAPASPLFSTHHCGGLYMMTPRISYSLPKADSVSAISIAIKIDSNLQAGDTILVVMGNFTAAANKSIDVELNLNQNATSQIFEGSVSVQDNTVSILLDVINATNISTLLQAGRLLNVRIPSAAGIRLPYAGITNGPSTIMMTITRTRVTVGNATPNTTATKTAK
jgi:hypothetical protein